MKKHTSIFYSLVALCAVSGNVTASCPVTGSSVSCSVSDCTQAPDVEARLQQVRAMLEEECAQNCTPLMRCCSPAIVESDDCLIIRMMVPAGMCVQCVDMPCVDQCQDEQCCRVRVVCNECTVDMMINEQSVCVSACPETRDGAPCNRTQSLPCAVCVNPDSVRVMHNPENNCVTVVMQKKSCDMHRMSPSCCPQ